MKKMKPIKCLAAALLAVGSLPAFASDTWSGTWDWSVPCNPTTCSVTGGPAPGTTVTATISAWGALELSSNYTGAEFYSGSSSYLGITSDDETRSETSNEPHHAIDNVVNTGCRADGSNCGGKSEMLAIEFTQAVDLSQVAVSWTWNDSDAQIWRWDGGASGPGLLSNYTPNQLEGGTSGWTLVKAGQFSASGNKLDVDGSVFSSYWMVGTDIGGTNDAFKIKTFTADVCKYTLQGGLCKQPTTTPGNNQVPEPTSLALAAVALAGLGLRRRRSRA